MDRPEENASSLSTSLIEIPEKIIDENLSIIDKKEIILEELRKQLWLAGPLISVSLLQFCLQLISVMFVGHLGELALSGASMATSFASVTGFSLLVSSLLHAMNYFSRQLPRSSLYHIYSVWCGMCVCVILLDLVYIYENNTSPSSSFVLQLVYKY